MKLFVIAALVAVAAAGRLEHLERAYLPPYQGFNSGAFGAAGAGHHGHNAGAPFPGATSNQYLPPDHGPSASNGAPEFAGSLQGFGAQDFRSSQFGSPQAAGSFGAPNYQAQFAQQSGAASRQYLAPKTYQDPPQQAFDEETGYHY